MRASIRNRIMTACCLLIGSSSVWASGVDPLATIQKKWAECQYQSKDEDQQIYCLENLVKLSESSLQNAPDRNDLKIWLAISKSSLAGADGGLGGLSLAKQAKALLEDVVKTAPETLDGSAYVTLGTLYYKVPGWPVGFGDDDKAEEMLKKALKYNPNGIDANYFYGDFLAEDGRKAEAIDYLKRAAAAPPRETRPLADQGRMAEIQRRLKELGAQ
ncbi:tetratricopeptide repeat protein [Vibrio rhizosphaerae]